MQKIRVPGYAIGAKVKTSTHENQDFLNMFIGFARKPVKEWPNCLVITNNINKKKEENKKYFQDKKNGGESNKKIR